MTRAIVACVLAAGLTLVGPAGVRATPLQCADPCAIVANGGSTFTPPFAEIRNGGTVNFTTPTDTHLTTDSTNAPCFSFSVTHATPRSVTFSMSGGALSATSAYGTNVPCTSGVSIPSVGYVLHYECLIHPWMHALLLIDS